MGHKNNRQMMANRITREYFGQLLYAGRKNTGSVSIPCDLITDENLSPTAKAVYMAMACYADEHGNTPVNEIELVWYMGLTSDQTYECVKELLSIGWVKTNDEPDMDGYFIVQTRKG